DVARLRATALRYIVGNRVCLRTSMGAALQAVSFRVVTDVIDRDDLALAVAVGRHIAGSGDMPIAILVDGKTGVFPVRAVEMSRPVGVGEGLAAIGIDDELPIFGIFGSRGATA